MNLPAITIQRDTLLPSISSVFYSLVAKIFRFGRDLLLAADAGEGEEYLEYESWEYYANDDCGFSKELKGRERGWHGSKTNL